MSEYNELHQDNKSSQDYEKDIERTREDIDETLSSLEDKLSPQQIWNRAVDDWSGGVKDFSGNFGRTLRDNPIPAVLMGVSLLWLMADPGGEKRPYTRASSSSSDESLGDKYHRVKSTASQKMKDVEGSVHDSYTGIKETVGGALDSARSKVSGTSERVSERYDDLRRRGSYGKRRARSQASNLVGNPWFLLAAGLAIGSIAALSAPVTDKEEQLMEEKGEDLIEKAKQAGREKFEQGKEVGKEVAASAADAAARTAQDKMNTKQQPASSEKYDPVTAKTTKPADPSTTKTKL